jgi:hypothetical protein
MQDEMTTTGPVGTDLVCHTFTTVFSFTSILIIFNQLNGICEPLGHLVDHGVCHAFGIRCRPGELRPRPSFLTTINKQNPLLLWV